MSAYNVPAALREVVTSFLAQGHQKVYTVVCCRRAYVGINPAKKCRTCDKPPENHEILSADDISKLGDLV